MESRVTNLCLSCADRECAEKVRRAQMELVDAKKLPDSVDVWGIYVERCKGYDNPESEVKG